jgi:D-alanyl-D-alanine endopeptidase (penicillin-binding protein 7)
MRRFWLTCIFLLWAVPLYGQSVVVLDPTSHIILYDSHPQAIRPIASLTKLMTVLVAERIIVRRDTLVTVLAEDTKNASTTYLLPKDRVSYDDLFHLALIGSDNVAARVLARTTLGPQFVTAMNRRALTLDLLATHYADPTGLDAANRSDAADMAQLLLQVQQRDYLAGIMQLASYTLTINHRVITVTSTNKLFQKNLPVQAGKTGFTQAAGFCLATILDATRPLLIVILGSESSPDRWSLAESLFLRFRPR